MYENTEIRSKSTFSWDLLTGRRIFYPFGLILFFASYCRDETDLIKQARGADFVTADKSEGKNHDFRICFEIRIFGHMEKVPGHISGF